MTFIYIYRVTANSFKAAVCVGAAAAFPVKGVGAHLFAKPAKPAVLKQRSAPVVNCDRCETGGSGKAVLDLL